MKSSSRPGLFQSFCCSPPVWDLGCPVDQLVSVAVDIVDDRVDDDLAGADRADPHIGAAGQDRRPARDAPPGIDAGEEELLARVELGDDRRIGPVAADSDARRY